MTAKSIDMGLTFTQDINRGADRGSHQPRMAKAAGSLVEVLCAVFLPER